MRGYTLIEVLVGLAIIGLLFTIGYAGYRDFAKRQVLNNVYEELKTNLNTARQRALSGEKSNCPQGQSDTLQGYKFTITSSNSYAIKPKCTAGDGTSVVSPTLPSGFTVSSAADPILFNALAQGTNLTGDVDITIVQLNGGSKKITITQQGTIK